VNFTARSVTSVRFTVTGVSSTTSNVGLAEIQTLGYPTSANRVAAPAGLTYTGIFRASETAEPAPGSTPEEARATVGVPPEATVGVGRSAAPQALFPLGTAVTLPVGEGWLRVHPSSLATVEGGPGFDERVLSAEVELTATTGQVDLTSATLAISDAEGNVYPASKATGDERLRTEGRLGEGDSVEGSARFTVPTSATSLSLVVLGPDGGGVIAAWSIAGH
jgi:hypothetical protein